MKDWFKKFFIPNQDNDFKPHALERAALVGMMLLVLISFSIANLQSILWITSDWLVSTILPAVVTDATNEARAEEGRAPLSRNSLLDEAARLKAEDMAAKEYFAHWSPEGTSPWHWFNEAGYAYASAGENLAVHFTDSGEVVDAWLDSPTHRANIMNGKFTEIGIGTAEGQYEGYDTVFVVQMFGAPAKAVATPTEPVVEEDVPVAETEAEIEVATSVPTEVAGASMEENVSVTDDGTVVYESFAATAVSNAETISARPTEPPSFWGRLLTSPRLILQIAYTLIGIFVVFALVTSIIIEWRRQHPVQIAYAVAMLLFMVLLFEVHMLASSGALVA